MFHATHTLAEQPTGRTCIGKAKAKWSKVDGDSHGLKFVPTARNHTIFHKSQLSLFWSISQLELPPTAPTVDKALCSFLLFDKKKNDYSSSINSSTKIAISHVTSLESRPIQANYTDLD